MDISFFIVHVHVSTDGLAMSKISTELGPKSFIDIQNKKSKQKLSPIYWQKISLKPQKGSLLPEILEIQPPKINVLFNH